MSSEDAPLANLGEEAMDTEQEWEEGAEEEMQEAPEGQEEEEGPQKTPRAAWARQVTHAEPRPIVLAAQTVIVLLRLLASSDPKICITCTEPCLT